MDFQMDFQMDGLEVSVLEESFLVMITRKKNHQKVCNTFTKLYNTVWYLPEKILVLVWKINLGHSLTKLKSIIGQGKSQFYTPIMDQEYRGR